MMNRFVGFVGISEHKQKLNHTCCEAREQTSLVLTEAQTRCVTWEWT